jgi:hypothetical protein
MGRSLRSGRGRDGLQVEYAEQQDAATVTPRVRTAFEAAIAQQHFE